MKYLVLVFVFAASVSATSAQKWSLLEVDSVVAVMLPDSVETKIEPRMSLWGASTPKGKMGVGKFTDPRFMDLSPNLSEETTRFLLRSSLKGITSNPKSVIQDTAFIRQSGVLLLNCKLRMEVDGKMYDTHQMWCFVNQAMYFFFVYEELEFPGGMKEDSKKFLESIRFNPMYTPR